MPLILECVTYVRERLSPMSEIYTQAGRKQSQQRVNGTEVAFEG